MTTLANTITNDNGLLAEKKASKKALEENDVLTQRVNALPHRHGATAFDLSQEEAQVVLQGAHQIASRRNVTIEEALDWTLYGLEWNMYWQMLPISMMSGHEEMRIMLRGFSKMFFGHDLFLYR